LATLLPAASVALTVLAASLPTPRIVLAQADTINALARMAIVANRDSSIDMISAVEIRFDATSLD
jgi:hypothetical protein